MERKRKKGTKERRRGRALWDRIEEKKRRKRRGRRREKRRRERALWGKTRSP